MSELWTDERIIAEVDDHLGEADSDTRERARRLLRRAALNEGRACEERVSALQARIDVLEAELFSVSRALIIAVDAEDAQWVNEQVEALDLAWQISYHGKNKDHERDTSKSHAGAVGA